MTTDNLKNDASLRAFGEAAARRLLGSRPISWLEIEELLPSLNRDDAKRYLDGTLDDPQRVALFNVLFMCRPGLKATLRPADVTRASKRVMVLRPEVTTVSTQTTLEPRLAASEAKPASRTLRWSGDGWMIELFPATDFPGEYVIALEGQMAVRQVTLFVFGAPLPLTKPLDDEGFGRAQADDLAEVLSGEASLELIVEPT